MMGSYFCFDIPGTLNTDIKEHFDIGQSQAQWLYTIYSLPNMVLPLFGGIFIDKIGVRPSLILFCAILTVG
jgi:MFS family permease